MIHKEDVIKNTTLVNDLVKSELGVDIEEAKCLCMALEILREKGSRLLYDYFNDTLADDMFDSGLYKLEFDIEPHADDLTIKGC